MAEEKSLFVTAEGLALSVAGQQEGCTSGGIKIPSRTDMESIDKAGGKQFLDATKGLDKVFDTGIFDSIQQSWNVKGCDNGKLKVCAMKCGAEFDFAEQSNKVSIVK